MNKVVSFSKKFLKFLIIYIFSISNNLNLLIIFEYNLLYKWIKLKKNVK